MEFIIITGLSGAGRTQVSHCLEDMNYYCIDNLPVAVVPAFADYCYKTRGKLEKVALVTDARAQHNFDGLFETIDRLRAEGCRVRILFVDAADNVILRRYKESRRPHPLAEEGMSLEASIRLERELMEPLRERADWVLDAGTTTLGQLKLAVSHFVAAEKEGILPVNVIAFGYKHGLPLEADLVFDVRFLPNPYYVDELKNLTGMDDRVQSYVFQRDPVTGLSDASEYLKRLVEMLAFLIPRYVEEGKSSLTIGVGCTGGRHRSVAMARALVDALADLGENPRLILRDTEGGEVR